MLTQTCASLGNFCCNPAKLGLAASGYRHPCAEKEVSNTLIYIELALGAIALTITLVSVCWNLLNNNIEIQLVSDSKEHVKDLRTASSTDSIDLERKESDKLSVETEANSPRTGSLKDSDSERCSETSAGEVFCSDLFEATQQNQNNQ